MLEATFGSWYASLVRWRPSRGSSELCLVCLFSRFRLSVELAPFPHSAVHELVVSLHAAAVGIAERRLDELEGEVLIHGSHRDLAAEVDRLLPDAESQVHAELERRAPQIGFVFEEVVEPRVVEYLGSSVRRLDRLWPPA